MAAEMPVQVEPVSGAVVVDFPWADALAAVTALDDAAATLGSQLDARATLAPTIADWAGAHRDEFDRADARLTEKASGLRESLAAVASWIVGGAESANQQQRTNNTTAEQGPVSATSGMPASPLPVGVPSHGNIPV